MTDYVELYMDQGSDFLTTIVLEDDTTNMPQNVISYVVTSSLRKSLLSQNSSANLVCTVSNAANGEISLSLPAANTAKLSPGKYLFDVVTTVSNIRTRVIEGIIIVTPSITKN